MPDPALPSISCGAGAEQSEHAVWKRRVKQCGAGEDLRSFDGTQSWGEAAELCKIRVNGMNGVLSSSEPPRTNTVQLVTFALLTRRGRAVGGSGAAGTG